MVATNLKSQIGEKAFSYLTNHDWLFRQYIIQNKSTRHIAFMIGCGKKAVLTALRRHNIEVGRSGVNKNKSIALIKNFERQTPSQAHGKLNDRKWMNLNYIVQNKSIKEISGICHVSWQCVRKWLRKHGIRKTEAQKQICSARRYKLINGYSIGSVEACKKRMRGRRGERIQTKKAGIIWCHSSWEKQVAEFLDISTKIKFFAKDLVKIPYEFQGKKHLYFVDFLVVMNTGKIILIEIKARRLFDDNRTKIKFKVLNEYANEKKYGVLILTGKNRLDISSLQKYCDDESTVG